MLSEKQTKQDGGVLSMDEININNGICNSFNHSESQNDEFGNDDEERSGDERDDYEDDDRGDDDFEDDNRGDGDFDDDFEDDNSDFDDDFEDDDRGDFDDERDNSGDFEDHNNYTNISEKNVSTIISRCQYYCLWHLLCNNAFQEFMSTPISNNFKAINATKIDMSTT